jgi:hypothetical protein
MTLVLREDETRVCAFCGTAGAVIVMAEPQWPQKFAPASSSAPHARQRRINRSPFRRLALIFTERLMFLIGFYSPVGVRASVVSARFFEGRGSVICPGLRLIRQHALQGDFRPARRLRVHRHLVDDLAFHQAFEYPG